ncbi:branched-chain amino acid transport system II carrier protein [Clostridium swellfunianum]|uniref:branched-chain amino acid transport system II carrier protein n=1 Tax=Clostridium swellfunianum TaxID=1367462 RepID=UPI00202E9F9C|nr:branched-chain amino acid transport system II carrier protein [Clostridium swellfunianum]MCM0646952.1 branched-chain amino acid transport system II carrier protein [Clostridium swellfunianum]
MKKSSKDIIVIGFALFAMFFGAGNLIFPPTLGKMVGTKFLPAIIGFLLTGVGLPLMGIIASAKINGSFDDMASKVSKNFSLIAGTALVLAIGPLLAIPRTAATTYELGIKPLFPFISPLAAIIIYFLINLAFVLKPSSIIDNIGKILTPILLLMLASIIIKGIVTPIGAITATPVANVLPRALLEGYQTMDAMASVMFSSIIIASVASRGYKKNSEIVSTTIKAGLVAVLGLAFVYGGLLYLGAQTVQIFPQDITKTELVIEIARRTLGSFGSIALGLSVALACLTTSIGLTATAAEFFSKTLTNGKVSYKVNVMLITVLSIFVAMMGVDNIVQFASPILSILYPVVIVLILTTLMGKLIKHNKVVAAAVYTTLVVSIIDTLTGLGYLPTAIKSIFLLIPLASNGFAWVIPAFVAMFISSWLIKDEGIDREELKKTA